MTKKPTTNIKRQSLAKASTDAKIMADKPAVRPKTKSPKTKSFLKEQIPHKQTHKEPQTMDELLSQSGEIDYGVKKGDVIEGSLISASSKEILFDIGKKSYGIVAEWELEQIKDYINNLQPGEKVTGHVISPENDNGYIVISLRRANVENRWTVLIQSKETGTDLEVTGLESAKGGILVDWQGLRGFIPSTQLESGHTASPASLFGKKITVKVIEVDHASNRLVFSQKAATLGVTPSMQKKMLDKVKPDDELKGLISGIAPFGVFVDIEGLEGLVHISEIAWEKVENLNNLYKVGDKVDVLILDVNRQEGKLNLSIKRLTPDPWKNILDRYPLESTISGKTVRTAPYGIFVQIEPGIEGLLHISKITAGEEPKVGSKINCIIENIDTVRRKISLTLVPKEKPVGYR